MSRHAAWRALPYVRAPARQAARTPTLDDELDTACGSVEQSVGAIENSLLPPTVKSRLDMHVGGHVPPDADVRVDRALGLQPIRGDDNSTGVQPRKLVGDSRRCRDRPKTQVQFTEQPWRHRGTGDV